MSAPKLYLSEHISPDVARAIRARGYDCISTQEAELRNQIRWLNDFR